MIENPFRTGYLQLAIWVLAEKTRTENYHSGDCYLSYWNNPILLPAKKLLKRTRRTRSSGQRASRPPAGVGMRVQESRNSCWKSGQSRHLSATRLRDGPRGVACVQGPAGSEKTAKRNAGEDQSDTVDCGKTIGWCIKSRTLRNMNYNTRRFKILSLS